MADKLIYNPNDDTQNYLFFRFLVEMFGHATKWTKNPQKSPKLLSKRIRKYYDKTLGTSVINSPMSPPSLNGITL